MRDLLLLRHFIDALVAVAAVVYSSHFTAREEHLACCLDRFITINLESLPLLPGKDNDRSLDALLNRYSSAEPDGFFSLILDHAEVVSSLAQRIEDCQVAGC